MISYTKRYVNVISLIITVILYIILSNAISQIKEIEYNLLPIFNLFNKNIIKVEISSNNIKESTKETNINKEIQSNYPNTNSEEKEAKIQKEEIKETQEDKKNIWQIEIPAISLQAEIFEGTSKEVMDEYVGHFTETSKTTGNIGLAAHNRGYKVNYFSNLKKLKEGDEIIYKCNEFKKTYVVEKQKIIKDIDWTPLEQTQENRITLITCVENEPEYRRCVQAIEKR